MSHLKELLIKLGYSEYALESEIITEDMLDEMDFKDELICCVTKDLFKDDNGNVNCKKVAADGKSFDIKSTVAKSCN
ncbi:unnamed protein product [Caenorhabditis brenneri]